MMPSCPTSGGSDSIDTAAKIAVRYWYEVGCPDKTIIISRESSYHGMHADGTSLAGIAANREHYGGRRGNGDVPQWTLARLPTRSIALARTGFPLSSPSRSSGRAVSCRRPRGICWRSLRSAGT